MCRFISLSSSDVWLMAFQFNPNNPGVVAYYAGKVTGKPAAEVNDPAKTSQFTTAAGDRPVTYSEGKMSFTSPSGAVSFSLAPAGVRLIGTMTFKSNWGSEDLPASFTCGSG